MTPFTSSPYLKDMATHMKHAIVHASVDLLERVACDYQLPLDEMLQRYNLNIHSRPATAEPKPKAKPKKQSPSAERTACCAINAKKQPCKRFAIDGSSLCKLHRRIHKTGEEEEEPREVRAAELEVRDDVMMHLDQAFDDSQKTVSIQDMMVTEGQNEDDDDLLNMLMAELQISA
jgi:hypothetical protein